MKFYVYVYTDPTNGLPFYVGKGQGNRYKHHLNKSHNRYLGFKIAKIREQGYEPQVDIVFRTQDENLAYETEEFLIRSYGRRVDGGLLCNFTLGGAGSKTLELPESVNYLLPVFTDSDIARLFGCSSSTIGKLRAQLGIERETDDYWRNPPPDNSEALKKPLKEELYQYLGVKSDYEIAELNGTSRKVVRRIREELGIPPCGKDGRFKKGLEPLNKDKRLWHLINEKTGETFVGHKVAFEKRYNVPPTNMAKLERGVYKSIARGFVLLMIEDVKDE